MKRKLQHLDLFSGIGGFSLGLEEIGLVETVAFCDFDKYCQQVLKKHWPSVPIFSDIKELTYEKLKANGINKIDIITGGYPCQPFSVAGRKKGEEDPRHVWPEYFRLVKELKPTWVIGENVSGHIKLGLDTVLENLESEGYSTRTFSISASSVGANHQRERVWIIAHSNNARNRTSEYETNKNREKTDERWQEQSQFEFSGYSKNMENTRRPLWTWSFEQGENEDEVRKGNADQSERSSGSSKFNVANTKSISGNGGKNRKHTKEGNTERKAGREGSYVANSNSKGLQGAKQFGTYTEETQTQLSTTQPFKTEGDFWKSEPDVGRVANGVPKRVDRLKSLGNSLVPQIPFLIGSCIKEIENI
jgi:DNA (cytosine-5)-methyltransferase 1